MYQNAQFNQYNQYNPYVQYSQELKVIKDIEIKFFRLLPPLFNINHLPLSGIYNDIENNEEDQENPAKIERFVGAIDQSHRCQSVILSGAVRRSRRI